MYTSSKLRGGLSYLSVIPIELQQFFRYFEFFYLFEKRIVCNRLHRVNIQRFVRPRFILILILFLRFVNLQSLPHFVSLKLFSPLNTQRFNFRFLLHALNWQTKTVIFGFCCVISCLLRSIWIIINLKKLVYNLESF